MLEFNPLDKESFEGVLPPSAPNLQKNKVMNRIFPMRSEEREDVRTVGTGLDKHYLEGFFDYSPTLSYADVTYNLAYGYINATLGFTNSKQEQCIEILGKYYLNITRDIP